MITARKHVVECLPRGPSANQENQKDFFAGDAEEVTPFAYLSTAVARDSAEYRGTIVKLAMGDLIAHQPAKLEIGFRVPVWNLCKVSLLGHQSCRVRKARTWQHQIILWIY